MTKSQKPFYLENPMSVLAYIGLSVITLGCYTIYYHYQLIGTFRRHGIGKVDDLLQTWKIYLIATVAAFILGIITDGEGVLGILSTLGGLGATIMMFVFARKAALAMKEYMDKEYGILVTFNSIVLFIFPGIGLCAIVNGIDKSVEYYGNRTIERKEQVTFADS